MSSRSASGAARSRARPGTVKRAVISVAVAAVAFTGVVGASGAVTLDDEYELTYSDGSVEYQPLSGATDSTDPAALPKASPVGLTTTGAPSVEDGLYTGSTTAGTGDADYTRRYRDNDWDDYNRGHGRRVVKKRVVKRWHGHDPFQRGHGHGRYR